MAERLIKEFPYNEDIFFFFLVYTIPAYKRPTIIIYSLTSHRGPVVKASHLERPLQSGPGF